MAKQRMINTRFWIDDYISHLDPTEKLLFLYFLTNPLTDICGIYEIPLKNIALDTGIDRDMVEKIIKRFEKDNKIYYENGWIGIKNFAKHQLDNPKVLRGIELGMQKAPKTLVNKVKYSLSIDYEGLSHSNSNSNPNSNSNIKSNTGEKNSPTPKEITQKFFQMVTNKDKEYEEFIEKMVTSTGMAEKIIKDEIKKFSEYWTELNSTGKKQRWEKEKVFEIKRRLTTWLNNNNKWSGNNNTKSKIKWM